MILTEVNSVTGSSSYEPYIGYSTVFLGTIGGIQVVLLGVVILMLFFQQKQLSRLEKRLMDVGRKNENGTPPGLEENKLLQS